MDNVFTYQSMTLPEFARSPKGTTAVFFCEWDKCQGAMNRITGKFKHQSLPVKGTCTIKSFNSIDADTGQAFKVLHAEVLVPVPALKKRGRPRKHVVTGTEVEGNARGALAKHIDDIEVGKLWPVY